MNPHPDINKMLPYRHAFREMFLYFIFVWMMISFIRLFIVENYSVPTGSMTPTLVGGLYAILDIDGDGDKDSALITDDGRYEILFNENPGYDPVFSYEPLPEKTKENIDLWADERHDNILVNKMAYWFHKPLRGDIAIFKPPRVIFQRATPIYVKRVVGLPGEVVGFDGDDHLVINDKIVTTPPFFRTQPYRVIPNLRMLRFPMLLGKGQYLFFGDNSLNSSDGRIWGPTPVENIRGRVFFRYRPFSEAGFM